MTNIVARYLSFEGRLARLPFFGRGVFLGVIAAAIGMASIPFFLPRRPVVVARHPYRCRGACPPLRWRRFPDHTAFARSGIVGLSRDLGYCRTGALGSPVLRAARSHARRTAACCGWSMALVLAGQPRPQSVRRKAGLNGVGWAKRSVPTATSGRSFQIRRVGTFHAFAALRLLGLCRLKSIFPFR
jgi:hypothetical protein